MSLGLGNVLIQGHSVSGGGSSTMYARYGVSVGSGNYVVLGQDQGDVTNPAQLTSTREIPMNGQAILYNFGSLAGKLKAQSTYAGDAQMMEFLNSSTGATSQATAIWKNDASKTLAVGIVSSSWTSFANNRYVDCGDGILITGDFLGVTTYKPRYLIDPTNGIFTWSISGSEKARISNAGNLLVGTATDIAYKGVFKGSSTVLSIRSTDSYPTYLDINSDSFGSVAQWIGTFKGSSINIPLTDGSFGIVRGANNLASFNNTDIVFNSSANAVNTNIKGDTDNNLFYAQGSTDRIGIGTNTPATKLHLNGSLRIDGQSAVTAGGAAGLHLIVNLDGTNYKIALLNV